MGAAPDQKAGPFFCVQGRDFGAFRTREDAEFALDAGDVKKGRWRFFTADGAELRLTTQGGFGDQRVIATDEVIGNFAEELQGILRYGLGLVKAKDRRISDGALANASLEELAEELARIYAD